jgi:hypothetical protein
VRERLGALYVLPPSRYTTLMCHWPAGIFIHHFSMSTLTLLSPEEVDACTSHAVAETQKLIDAAVAHGPIYKRMTFGFSGSPTHLLEHISSAEGPFDKVYIIANSISSLFDKCIGPEGEKRVVDTTYMLMETAVVTSVTNTCDECQFGMSVAFEQPNLIVEDGHHATKFAPICGTRENVAGCITDTEVCGEVDKFDCDLLAHHGQAREHKIVLHDAGKFVPTEVESIFGKFESPKHVLDQLDDGSIKDGEEDATSDTDSVRLPINHPLVHFVAAFRDIQEARGVKGYKGVKLATDPHTPLDADEPVIDFSRVVIDDTLTWLHGEGVFKWPRNRYSLEHGLSISLIPATNGGWPALRSKLKSMPSDRTITIQMTLELTMYANSVEEKKGKKEATEGVL